MIAPEQVSSQCMQAAVMSQGTRALYPSVFPAISVWLRVLP